MLHLGDYIYEDEVGVPGQDERAMVPAKEIVTLYDYRTRIAQYRSDTDLQTAHKKFPFITVWVSLKQQGTNKKLTKYDRMIMKSLTITGETDLAP